MYGTSQQFSESTYTLFAIISVETKTQRSSSRRYPLALVKTSQTQFVFCTLVKTSRTQFALLHAAIHRICSSPFCALSYLLQFLCHRT